MTPNELRELWRLLDLACDMATSMIKHHKDDVGTAGVQARANWNARRNVLEAAHRAVDSILAETDR